MLHILRSLARQYTVDDFFEKIDAREVHVNRWNNSGALHKSVKL
jgi:hypothetical protein